MAWRDAHRKMRSVMPKKSAVVSVADANPAPGGVAAVDRAVSLLAAFGPGDAELTLAELAERTGLYKSTVLRLLASLEHGGLVQRRADRYALGHAIARLNAIYAASFSLGDVVMPVLRQLVDRTQETAAFHIAKAGHRVCLHRVDSPQPIRYHVGEGDVLPLDRGAGGRLLSAFMGAQGEPYEQIRREGYVVLEGDRLPDVAGISAVVTDARGELVGAVTLTMPVSRLSAALTPAVLWAADAITVQLGGLPRFGPD